MDENVVRCRGLIVEIKYKGTENKKEKDFLLSKALLKFKNKVKDSKIMLELHDRAFFNKPSAKKRHKRNLAIIKKKI
jgi:ribosomal protein S21